MFLVGETTFFRFIWWSTWKPYHGLNLQKEINFLRRAIYGKLQNQSSFSNFFQIHCGASKSPKISFLRKNRTTKLQIHISHQASGGEEGTLATPAPKKIHPSPCSLLLYKMPSQFFLFFPKSNPKKYSNNLILYPKKPTISIEEQKKYAGT